MNRAAGLSLIELMIALLLGVILTLGATQVYLGTSQSYRLTDGIAHAQETVRFATTMMQRDIRNTGGMACLQNEGDITERLGGGALAVALADGITGWEANGTSSGDAIVAGLNRPGNGNNWSEGSGGAVFPAVLAPNIVAGTDILIVNTAETLPVAVLDNANNTGSNPSIELAGPSGLPQGRIVLAADDNCAVGELFRNNNQSGDASVAIAGGNLGSYSDDARIASFSTKAFYVGIRNGATEPALFMQRLDGNGDAAVELVEGVESMQVMYGLSDNETNQADRYVSANAVNDWSEVMSVRVAFMIRSVGNANSENITRTFNLLGTQVTSPNDQRARVVASTTIGLRNRLE